MKHFVMAILLVAPLAASARVGPSETLFPTPGGHQICDCDPYQNTPVLVGFEDVFNRLESWYFYKGRIVGKTKHFFFIFDEPTKSPQVFLDERQWKAAINDQKLSPLYTRWLTIDDAPDPLLYVTIVSAYVWVPIMLGIIILLVILILATRLKWTRRRWAIAVVVLLATAALVALRFNVQSF